MILIKQAGAALGRVVVLLLLPFAALAGDEINDVRLHSLYFNDAAMVQRTVAEAGFGFYDHDGAVKSVSSLELRALGPIAEHLELGGEVSMREYKYAKQTKDHDTQEGGISDIRLVGRYHQPLTRRFTHLTFGVELTLPTGDEDLDQGKINVGGFTAVRGDLDPGLVGLASVGLHLVDIDDNHQISLHSGAGLIYTLKEKIHLSGEFLFKTEEEYAVITTAADFKLADSHLGVSNSGRLRTALSFGVADGAPDVALYVGYGHTF
ncbi:MAG: hypothetical protein HQL49_09320 [Gammaproteobacteria bacterium]|nr:hypothetical protein [Gammaproteobacteria bacterium]